MAWSQSPSNVDDVGDAEYTVDRSKDSEETGRVVVMHQTELSSENNNKVEIERSLSTGMRSFKVYGHQITAITNVLLAKGSSITAD